MNFSNSNKTFFGDLALQCFEISCTHRHTHTHHVTSHDFLKHLRTHLVLRFTIFCTICTHTPRYVARPSVALALTHTHSHSMLRCTVKSWTAPGVVLNHVQEQLSNTRDPTVDKTPTQLANEQICFDLALNSERRFRGWTLHKRSDMKVQNGRFFRLIFDDSKLKTRIRQMVFSVECGGPCPDAFILKHCRSCHSRPEHLFSFLAMNAKYVL